MSPIGDGGRADGAPLGVAAVIAVVFGFNDGGRWFGCICEDLTHPTALVPLGTLSDGGLD